MLFEQIEQAKIANARTGLEKVYKPDLVDRHVKPIQQQPNLSRITQQRQHRGKELLPVDSRSRVARKVQELITVKR